MKVVIIEDEHLAAEALADMVKSVRPGTEILAMPGSVVKAVEWLLQHQAPDLIFCDIHLSDGISFEIFTQVEVKCPIIFTTAYNQYALDAFKVNSIDYLLKPVDPEDVAAALKKYDEVRRLHLTEGLGNMQGLLQAFQPPVQSLRSRFLVKTGQTIKVVPVQEIAFFHAEEGVVFLVTIQKKKYIVNFTLDQLEEQLDGRLFFRINRQFMVSVNAIHEVKPYLKGRLYIVSEPPSEEDLFVSSSRASTFKQWLDS